MSTTWWSDKHNIHHARTNEVTVDEDIATDPALFLWAPDPKNDVPWRKYQGLYLPFPMSLLFLIWRFDSVKVAIERKKYDEIIGLACHYAFMLSFVSPLTFLGAMLVSGFITAVITTVGSLPHIFQLLPTRRSLSDSSFHTYSWCDNILPLQG